MNRLTHTLTFVTTAVIALLIATGSTRAASVGTFTGGDAGEGLDLEGTFIYAIDTGSNDTGAPIGPDRPVGDAVFKDNWGRARPNTVHPDRLPRKSSTPAPTSRPPVRLLKMTLDRPSPKTTRQKTTRPTATLRPMTCNRL